MPRAIGKFITLLAIISILYSDIRAGEQSFTLTQPLAMKWSYPSNELTNVAPISDNGMVYMPITGGRLIALRVSDGQLLWNAEIGGGISISPSVDPQHVYVASETSGLTRNGDATGVLRAISKLSGVTLWSHSFPATLNGTLAVNDHSIFASSTDGKIYALDKRTGELRWDIQSTGLISSSIAINATRLFFGTDNGYLNFLDPKTGSTLERYQTPTAIQSIVAITGGSIYFGTKDGFVSALSERAGGSIILWRKRAGVGVRSINYTPYGILVTTQDNFVMLFSLRRGKRLWKKQMPARLASPPLLWNDGALFAPVGEEACIALSLLNGRQINSLFIGKDNSALTSPVASDDTILIPTRSGLLAFTAAK